MTTNKKGKGTQVQSRLNRRVFSAITRIYVRITLDISLYFLLTNVTLIFYYDSMLIQSRLCCMYSKGFFFLHTVDEAGYKNIIAVSSGSILISSVIL